MLIYSKYLEMQKHLWKKLLKLNLKYNQLKEISLLLGGVDIEEIVELINSPLNFKLEINNTELKLKNIEKNKILKLIF
jgi:hypothetical protein